MQTFRTADLVYPNLAPPKSLTDKLDWRHPNKSQPGVNTLQEHQFVEIQNHGGGDCFLFFCMYRRGRLRSREFSHASAFGGDVVLRENYDDGVQESQHTAANNDGVWIWALLIKSPTTRRVRKFCVGLGQ